MGAQPRAVGRAVAWVLAAWRRWPVPPLDRPLAGRPRSVGGRDLGGRRLADRGRRRVVAAEQRRARGALSARGAAGGGGGGGGRPLRAQAGALAESARTPVHA